VLDSVWDSVRASVWDSVRASVGDSVLAYTSSFFNLPRSAWKYTERVKCKGNNPFQPAIDLWKMGLVPSFDGKKWRLHGGEDGGVMWEDMYAKIAFWGKGVDDHDGKYQERLEATKEKALTKNHWDDLDDETFNSILLDIAGKLGVAGILGTPGVLEILREELNNEVLEEWAERNNRDPNTGAPLEDEA